MALIFMDGFDKYGAANNNTTGVQGLLTSGEWTTGSASTLTLIAPLSATGQALQIAYNAGSGTLSKTLSASYGRLIGGIRFRVDGLSSSNNAGVAFVDNVTTQCSLTINGGTGLISLRNGAVTGTALATSGVAVSVGSINYLEWDITFGNAAAYQVWLNGASLFSGTGDTTGSANNSASVFAFVGTISGSTISWDDLYLFDSTGTTNNAPLLTSPRIETTFPVSDSAVQFGFGAAILGSAVSRTVTTAGTVANTLFLRRYVPTISCTINSITLMPATTNASVNMRGVVYADSAGAAGSLMSAGSTIVGTATGVAVTLPLTTPQNLTVGTPYWFGFMTDVALSPLQLVDGSNAGYRATVTFASGAPGTAPAMTSAQQTFLVWGNLAGISGNNWYEAAQQPPPGAPSYVFDATVGHEDLYNFNALSVPPTNIYAVAVKGYLQKSDSGTKTVSLRTKSGATDSGGSLAGQALGTSYGWMTSLFPTDPNTSAAWTGSALNAATSGVRVDS